MIEFFIFGASSHNGPKKISKMLSTIVGLQNLP